MFPSGSETFVRVDSMNESGVRNINYNVIRPFGFQTEFTVSLAKHGRQYTPGTIDPYRARNARWRETIYTSEVAVERNLPSERSAKNRQNAFAGALNMIMQPYHIRLWIASW